MVKTISWNSLDSSSKFYFECDYAENGQVVADKTETGENAAEYEYINGTTVINSVKYVNGSKLAYDFSKNGINFFYNIIINIVFILNPIFPPSLTRMHPVCGKTVKYAYGNGNLTTVTFADGSTVKFDTDASNITAVERCGNTRTEIEYNHKNTNFSVR